MNKLTAVIILFYLQLSVFGQQNGIPFITNFPPDIYKGSGQNWDVVQDNRGVMYFANNEGVLEFDGITWRLIETVSLVRSLARDNNGRIYVGMTGDFGYLQTDSLGRFQYKSLKDKIAPQDQDFNDIYKIIISGNRIFFQAYEKIFVLHNEKFTVINPNISFHFAFVINNTFYVWDEGNGLTKYENDSLQLVAQLDQFAKESILSMWPYSQNEILIATSTQGVWIYSLLENKSYKPKGFSVVDNFLTKNVLYGGTTIHNNSYALCTLLGGIIVFDKLGAIQAIYNTDNGLQDNSVNSVYSDNNDLLWAATDNGISLVQNNLPFQQYTEKNNLKGVAISINYFDNHLYVGTGQYLCVLKPDGNFEAIAGTENQNWQLYPMRGKLLLAHLNGLFEIKGNKALPIISNAEFLDICEYGKNSNYMLAGFSNGINVLEYTRNTWKIKNYISGFTKTVYKVVHDKNDIIWAYTFGDLYRLKFNETSDSVISEMHCTSAQGLPGNDVSPFVLNSGEVVFGTEKGVYRYLPDSQTFEIHPDFDMLSGFVVSFQQLENNDIWFQEETGPRIFETGVLKHRNGKYQLFKQAFYKFTDFPAVGPYSFCLGNNSAVYIATEKGILKYNPTLNRDYNKPFQTLIRNVFASDSLLYGGAPLDISMPESEDGRVLAYSQNNLVFHFAAPFFEDAERNKYSYRLLGLDTTWSAWVSDVKKEYTLLSEGDYVFEVRSKNQYRVVGSTASYAFRILPPIHRTWWAYTLYVLAFIAFGFVILKIYTKRLVAQKQHLEQIVKERTHEIIEKNEELQQQKEEIIQTLEVVNQQKEELIVTLEVVNQQKEEILVTLEVVNQQKQEIEKSHKHITESINYASLIQTAVLPNKEWIDMILPQHFIIFKPRDIVSGDFYFIKQIKNTTLIAAADCTGHGVPGAFMSMLGIAILNELVLKPEIITASHLLNELRQQIKSSLHNSGRENDRQDGMDIAICAINIETKEMSYAGAYNPCWIFRNSETNNPIELSANRQPVGVYVNEIPFTEHKFQLLKDDVLYLFSDGFHSQFGGMKDRPLKTKYFREMLSEIFTLPINDQKQLLENKFDEWKSSYKQTDDVLVIGIKIA